MMPRLIQLPSGTWLDPEAITSIRVVEPSKDFPQFGYRLSVGYLGLSGSSMFDQSPFDTHEAARKARDRIAAAVNAARAEAPEPTPEPDGTGCRRSRCPGCDCLADVVDGRFAQHNVTDKERCSYSGCRAHRLEPARRDIP